MKCKKVGVIVLAAMLTLALSGCSSTTNTSSNTSSSTSTTQLTETDQEFFTDLQTALYARWDFNNSKSDEELANMTMSEGRDYYNQLVNSEWEVLSKYQDATFSDSVFTEAVNEYMSGLELQRESLDYYNNTNYYEYLEKWSDGYQQRLKAINFFVSEYGFTVDSKHQSDLDEVLQEASSIEKTEEKEQQIQDMVKNANWQKNEEKSDSDYMVYEATITNTTNDTFSAFWISVNELDSNGVITDSTSSNTVNNWAPGSAVKFSYSVSSDTASVEYNAEFSVE